MLHIENPGEWFRLKFRLAVGCLLLVAGVWGGLYAMDALRAQRLYHMTRHGMFLGYSNEVPPSMDARTVARRCMAAENHYPYNYRFYAYVAECELKAAVRAQNAENYKIAVDGALYFSERALALCPTSSEARWWYVQTLMQIGRTQEAVDFCKKIVDREFWNPPAHNLYAMALLRDHSPKSLQLAVYEIPFVDDTRIRDRLVSVRNILRRR